MQLLTFTGAPSPRRVTLYLAEKRIELDTAEVNIRQDEHLCDEFEAKSPDCTVPVLELDDSTCLWASRSIREYLESLHPDPPLHGRDAREHALVSQWVTWIEHNGFLAAAEAFRNKAAGMKDHAVPGRRPVAQIPELADRGKQRIGYFMEDLDKFLSGRDYIAGDAFTVADIDGLVVMDFGMRATKLGMDEHDNLAAWYARVNARDSVTDEQGA